MQLLMVRSSIALVLLLGGWLSQTRAEYQLKEFLKAQEIPDGKKALEVYVVGLGRGIQWTNVAASRRGNALFCLPDKLSFDSAMFWSLLEQEIHRPTDGQTYGETDPIEWILLRSFVGRFPCPAEQQVPKK